MKYFILLYIGLFLMISSCTKQQDLDTKEIQLVMKKQEEAWNNGNLDKFMEGYWNSDSLKFIGKRGLTYGWTKTLDNYTKSYPNKEVMGELKFNIINSEIINSDNAFVIGKWALYRTKDTLGGHFTLQWKNIGGEWVIVSDHTS